MNHIDTVMIVDDNFEDRFILKRFLQKTGLSLVILEASNGWDGMKILTTPIGELSQQYPGINVPVILFLDINMPLMDGWQFVEELEIRRDEIKLRPMIVLMYSTSDDDEDKRKAHNNDTVENYIVKGESSPGSLKKAILSCRENG